MPITQSRMIDLILTAESYHDALAELCRRLVETQQRIANRANATQALLEVEWYFTLINNFPDSQEYIRQRANLTVEHKWFDKNAKDNNRRALVKHIRQARHGSEVKFTGRKPGANYYRGPELGPQVVHQDLSEYLQGPVERPQRAATTKVRGPDWAPVGGLEDTIKINTFMKEHGITDRNEALMYLGFEHETLVEEPEVLPTPASPTPKLATIDSKEVPDHLAPDENIGDFSGLGGED